MDFFEAVGLTAAALTTASFVPQVAHVVIRRSARDISPAWLFLFGSGIALWLIYGLSLGSLPIIVANAVTFLLVLVMGWYKFTLPDTLVAPVKETA